MVRRSRVKASDPKKVDMAKEGTAGKGQAVTESVTRPNATFSQDRVLGYLQMISVDKLDGLWIVLKEKMAELGIKKNREKYKVIKVSGNPSGNLGSLVRLVRAVKDGDNYADLLLIEAVVANRFKTSGYQPVENINDPSPSPE